MIIFKEALSKIFREKSALYFWVAMSAQLLFMVVIVPLASVKLDASELAFWLSALLLTGLSAPADFGVYNTIVRGLPFIKAGKAFPEFLSQKQYNNTDRLDEACSKNNEKVNSLVLFGFNQLVRSITVVLIVSIFISYFIYSGRANGIIDYSYILTLFLYWLVIPIHTLARFLESILMGWGLISLSKKNEAITTLTRVIIVTPLIFYTFPIYMYAMIHLLTTTILLFLNFRIANREIFKNFDFTKFSNCLTHFSNAEKLSFKKGQYRFGVNIFSSYLIMNAGPLAVTNLKADESVSFYLVMARIFNAIKQFAQVPITVAVPSFVLLRVNAKIVELLSLFTKRSKLTIALYTLGFCSSFIYFGYVYEHTVGNYIIYLYLYGFIMLLELNHSNHAQLVLSRNVQPFVIPSIAAGILSFLLIYPMFLAYGIIGAIIVQGLIQLLFSNWYPVYLNVKEFNEKKLIYYAFK